jgi:hypothetical protein
MISVIVPCPKGLGIIYTDPKSKLKAADQP